MDEAAVARVRDQLLREAERRLPADPDAVPPGTFGAGENVCRRCAGCGRIGDEICPDCAGSGRVTTPIGGG